MKKNANTQQSKRFSGKLCRFGAVFTAASMLAMVTPQARAWDIVFDPTNFAKNTVTAAQSIQTQINTAQQLVNQYTQLANEARNLATLPASTVQQLSGSFSNLYNSVSGLSSMVTNVGSLESAYQNMFPQFGGYSPTMSGAQALSMTQGWSNMLNGNTMSTLKLVAQQLSQVASNGQAMQGMLSSSQGAVGAVQAIQAGNQLAGAIGTQLQTMNVQMAAYEQAHLQYLQKQQADQDLATAVGTQAMQHTGWNTSRAPANGVSFVSQ
ncbi:P-type conjugative transfer protein TrbJ [Burkholderia sp. BCC1993]|uniref:P-type conjugative transfer protein TrbJ n=1 Tax=Burkholderia sp. BCC1993 TaxID=2817444 RepID=UPI002AB149F9|nr:P-type conjugative transfer protein TrbJ [Burkholderia sp. BCC1993]